MNLSSKIDSIISSRSKNIASVDSALNNLIKLNTSVNNFAELQETIRKNKNAVSDDISQAVIRKVLGISTKSYMSVFNEYSDELERLKKRFCRKNINISFVGRAGQGKSLTLRKISGLVEEIPSAKGADCTGAKSIIINTDTDKSYADITFFSESEMVDIVNRYLEEIFENKSKNISSVDEISSLRDNISFSGLSSTKGLKITELMKYVDNIDSIKNHLGQSTTVEKEKIEEYVAMFKENHPDIRYNKYLAVKCAEIHCRFPKKDAGKIVLVDTIGMGSQSLGVGESLMDTVKNDSDAIVYMQRPDDKRGHLGEEDTIIADEIIRNITEEGSKKIMFWVLNKTKINAANVKIVRSQFADYPVADVLTVDCSSEEDVENNLLTPLLEKIAVNVKEIDELYISRINKLAEKLYDEYEKIGIQIRNAYVDSVPDSFIDKYNDDMKITYKGGIRTNIRKLYEKYSANVGQKCQPMEDLTLSILDNMYKLIPSEDYIKSLMINEDLLQHKALLDTFELFRFRIINSFFDLDKLLAEMVNRMKNEVINILTNSDEDSGKKLGGKLGKVVPFEYDPENEESLRDNRASEWIKRFINENRGNNHFELIKSSLETLDNFKVSVQGFFIHEIRIAINAIDPSLQESFRVRSPRENEDSVAEEIRELLKDHEREINYSIKKAAAELYKTPNNAIFAAVRDFYDRISFSENADENINTEWDILYRKWCPVIWSGNYDKVEASRGIVSDLKKIANEFEQINKKSDFIIK